MAKSAGNHQLKYFGNISNVGTKSTDIDLITKADIESEKIIIEQIRHKFPDHGIISEESNFQSSSNIFQWVIDPLDGTTNFVHNLPIFAVSIGLMYHKKPILGVVYNPAADKCFSAAEGMGAYLNGEVISVSKNENLKSSLIVTGFPYKHDVKWELGFDIFKNFYSRTQGLRRLGAASLDLCFVAMGRLEGFYEFNLEIWDICAGIVIAQEAGANVSDWDGTEPPLSGDRILCTNRLIHKEMTDILMNKKYSIFFKKNT